MANGMGSGTLPVWFAILDFADAFASKGPIWRLYQRYLPKAYF
jgi:hypothetical protein